MSLSDLRSTRDHRLENSVIWIGEAAPYAGPGVSLGSKHRIIHQVKSAVFDHVSTVHRLIRDDVSTSSEDGPVPSSPRGLHEAGGSAGTTLTAVNLG